MDFTKCKWKQAYDMKTKTWVKNLANHLISYTNPIEIQPISNIQTNILNILIKRHGYWCYGLFGVPSFIWMQHCATFSRWVKTQTDPKTKFNKFCVINTFAPPLQSSLFGFCFFFLFFIFCFLYVIFGCFVLFVDIFYFLLVFCVFVILFVIFFFWNLLKNMSL